MANNKKRAKRRTKSEIRRAILADMARDRDSLISIMLEFKSRAIADRRKTIVSGKQAGIDADLALRVLDDVSVDSSYVRLAESKIRFYAGKDENFEQMNISFITLDRETGEWDDFTNMPLMFYIAATFDRYTIKMVEDHLEEIEKHLPMLDWTLETAHRDACERYLRAMRNHNKRLPDDLKLWLELR